MAVLVLEQTFEQPITTEELNDSAKRVDKCLEQYGAHWMRTYLSKDRKRMVCEFEAPDAEQVRAAYRAAGMSFDSCWTADLYSVDKPTASY